MPSSFYGIYNSQRSLLLNQAALNVVSNNIANMNTEGYSKQRLEISQKTTASINCYLPEVAAQSGAGATIDDITRNRDFYLDAYYRKENSTLSYFKEYYTNTQLVEGITDALGDTGVADALDAFFEAANDLSSNPTDMVCRTNFLQAATDVCTLFNNTSSQLTDLRESLVGDGVDSASLTTSKLNLSVNEVNDLLGQISDLNNTIAMSTAQGTTPNGLLDERDKLIDNLSSYIPITVTNGTNNLVSVNLGGVTLIQGSTQTAKFTTEVGDENNPAVLKLEDLNDVTIVGNANDLVDSGSLGAILDIAGNDSDKVTIKGLLNDLDEMARSFASEVNAIQESGQYINSTSGELEAQDPTALIDIFVEQSGVDSVSDYANLTAANIQINNTVLDDPYYVATANVATTAAVPPDTRPTVNTPTATGDVTAALAYVQLRDKELTIGSYDGVTLEDYLTTINGNFGVQSKSIYNNYSTQDTILEEVQGNRDSATGVSLEEEYMDLIKFQKAYQATSKVFNIMSEVLDTVINLAK